MIDLHCHILPGLDDGPATLDESLEMCRMAASDGVRTIVAATHFRPGAIEPDSGSVRGRLQELQQALVIEGIGISVLPGAEVTVTPELPKHLDLRDWLFVNNSGRYVIVEFSQDAPPLGWNFLL
jgi:protein-tyrosine phosphatase